MSPIKLITFDVTNTIIRVLGSVGKSYSAVAGMYGVTVCPDKLTQTFKLAYKKRIVDYPNFGVNQGQTPKQWWDSLVIDSFEAAGSTNEKLPIIASHLYKHFSTRKGFEAINGADELLAGLKHDGYKLGAVSNFDERLETILTELSLRHYFDFVLASAVERCAKPEPEMYNLSLKMAGVKAEECIHVGDDVTNDYIGPRSAGMLAILCTSKERPEAVDREFCVDNLNDILPLVRTLSQKR